MASRVLAVIVSSTSLRSSEATSERPTAFMAPTTSSRWRPSEISASMAAAPLASPEAPASGTQCASTHAPGVISAVKVTSPPSARLRYWGSEIASRAAASPSTLWPRASARATPVSRSMAAFQWTTVRPVSTTTSAPRNVSMRLASNSSRRRGIQVTIARGSPVQ